MNEDLVQLVESVRFTPVRLREGYDMGEVDQFLSGMVKESERRQSGAPADVHQSLTDVPAHPGNYPVAASESRSVIEEQPGLFRRMFGRK